VPGAQELHLLGKDAKIKFLARRNVLCIAGYILRDIKLAPIKFVPSRPKPRKVNLDGLRKVKIKLLKRVIAS
jgi:hypothetical protein